MGLFIGGKSVGADPGEQRVVNDLDNPDHACHEERSGGVNEEERFHGLFRNR
jgi:hypothetical protein